MRKTSIFLIFAGIFSMVMVLTSCASIPPAERMAPDADTARVYFIMTSGVTVTGFGAVTVGTQFTLWNGDTFLSNIGGSQYLVFNFKAGPNTIMAQGNNFFVIDANLTAGNTYYFRVITLPGFSRPHVRIVQLGADDPDLDRYLKNDCKEIVPKGKVSDSMVAQAAKKLTEIRNDPEKINLVVR